MKNIIKAGVLIPVSLATIFFTLNQARAHFHNSLGCAYDAEQINTPEGIQTILIWHGETDRENTDVQGPCPPEGFQTGGDWVMPGGSNSLLLTFSDNTAVEYTMGGIRVGSDSITFLCNTVDSNTITYMQTSNFVPGAGTSIHIDRQIDILLSDTGCWPTCAPTSSAFSSSSQLKYLLELHDASTGDLIQVLDTCIVTLNSMGYYQYVTSGNTTNSISVTSMADSSQSVYISLHLIKTLPLFSSPTTTTYNFGVLDIYQGYYGDAQYVSGAPKQVIPGASWTLPSSMILNFNAFTDASTGISVASINSLGSYHATLNTFDIIGRVVSSNSIEISEGLNKITLPIEGQPHGIFYVELIVGGYALSTKLQR